MNVGAQIGFGDVALSVLLVAVAVVVSRVRGVGLERDMGIATVRSFVQLLAIGYVLAGIVACILIVTIPFGIASFRIAAYALWPFGRSVVRRADAGAGSAIGNILWVLLFGLSQLFPFVGPALDRLGIEKTATVGYHVIAEKIGA